VSRLLSWFLFALSIASMVVPLALAKGRDPAHEITSQLICPCSCGEVLSGCTCETGKSMQATVENGIKQGRSKDQIVGGLVSQYGEVIRGAPKPQGFNLIVWVAPFLATIAGFGIAFLVLHRWVRRRAALGPAGPSVDAERSVFGPRRSVDEDLDALRARAEAEIRQLRR
jgi:cytochrome c-type biogenesis protein CcmH/NrfF